MRGARRAVGTIAYAGLIALTAWLLYAVAQREFTIHLRDQAARALALAAIGDTPYRWRFRDSEDIVAGRAFGTDDIAFHDGTLIARAHDSPFEIGLPLPRVVDLRLFPRLQIAASAEGRATLDVLVRETLESPELALSTGELRASTGPSIIDLGGAGWKRSGAAVGAPKTAAMLRLRVIAPAGVSLHLSAAALLRDAAPLDLSVQPRVVSANTTMTTHDIPIYRLPLRGDLRNADLGAIARSAAARQQPLILLPQHGRVEQQIALRNAVFTALPGAILIPEGAVEETFALAQRQPGNAGNHEVLRWTLLALYASALLLGRVSTPRSPRRRAAMELALVLFGPLWLIVFDGFTGRPDAVQSLLIAATTAYAVSLSFPRRWLWNGDARTWLLAFGVIAAALVLGFALHDGSAPARAISPSHSARYIGWALAQQYLICAVCADRWRRLLGNKALAAYCGALGFALLHTPNAALMLATFVGGLCWCAIYLRGRALMPLAISHAASALLLLALLPRSLLASAEVSARFFQ